MKVLGKNVLVKGYVKKESSSGLLLSGNTEENIERARHTCKIIVINVGPDVKGVSTGDKVVILRDTLMKLSNDVTKWIAEGKDDEYYLLVNEEDIKLVL